jgi:Flp pilus assembly CpaE family ATPase
VGGGNPERQIRQALRRHAGVEDVVTVPYDRAGYDAALAQGRALFEVAPHSAARRAIRELAGRLAGVATEPKRARRKRQRDTRPVPQPEPGAAASKAS